MLTSVRLRGPSRQLFLLLCVATSQIALPFWWCCLLPATPISTHTSADGVRWPLAASPKKLQVGKKRLAAFISSLQSEIVGDFWQRAVDWKNCSFSSQRGKDQLALRTLSPREEHHVLCPSSPHCSALPLPMCRDSPPASRDCSAQLFPCFKADPSMEAAILQPNYDSRGAESSSRLTQMHKMGARDLPGTGKGSQYSTFSSLYCSPQGQETVWWQERCARAPLGPASPMQADFRQLALCSQ